MYPNAHASSSRVRLPAQQLVDETMDELLGEMEDMSFNVTSFLVHCNERPDLT